MEWYLKVLKQHYADFGGRARRQEYWMFVLINMIIGFLIMAGSGAAAYATGVGSIASLSFLYQLAVFIPGIAVSVRRMHDIGKSGWMLLVGLVPLIGVLIVLYFMVLDSQPGNNEYGPNPKGA